jgi:hypothetical protein
LERDEKALIDLVDGLSSGLVVLVRVTDGDLADHNARLRGGAAERFLGHGDQVQAIGTTLLVVVGVLLGGDGLGSDQTPSRRMIDEGGLQRLCNHRQAFWPAQNIGSRTLVGRSLRPAIRSIFLRWDLKLASLAMMFCTYGMRSWRRMVCGPYLCFFIVFSIKKNHIDKHISKSYAPICISFLFNSI